MITWVKNLNMEKQALNDAYQVELNDSYTNSHSQIVFNDLRLLELLQLHPFLISSAIRGYGDRDYEKWGWQQVTESFNASYEQDGLNPFFLVEELQRRWEILKPLCLSPNNAAGSQIMEPLSDIVKKTNRLLLYKRPIIKCKSQRMTAMQHIIIQQMPMVERLPQALRRQLEVEILDAIIKSKRQLYTKQPVQRIRDTASRQYDQFLWSIRVKELPPHVISNLRNGHCTDHSCSTSISSSSTAHIVNSKKSDLVISNVCCIAGGKEEKEKLANPLLKEEEPVKLSVEDMALGNILTAPELIIKDESPDIDDVQEVVRNVSLQDATRHTRKVRVKLKRLKPAVKSRIATRRLTRHYSLISNAQ